MTQSPSANVNVNLGQSPKEQTGSPSATGSTQPWIN